MRALCARDLGLRWLSPSWSPPCRPWSVCAGFTALRPGSRFHPTVTGRAMAPAARTTRLRLARLSATSRTASHTSFSREMAVPDSKFSCTWRSRLSSCRSSSTMRRCLGGPRKVAFTSPTHRLHFCGLPTSSCFSSPEQRSSIGRGSIRGPGFVRGNRLFIYSIDGSRPARLRGERDR